MLTHSNPARQHFLSSIHISYANVFMVSGEEDLQEKIVVKNCHIML